MKYILVLKTPREEIPEEGPGYDRRDVARRAARRKNDRMRREKTTTPGHWDYMEVEENAH